MKAVKNFQNLNVVLPDKMKRENKAVVDDFKTILLQAQEQKRLICGVYESGKQLENDPDDVMLCILPACPVEEATLHIHLTLLEAYCLEIGVQIVKVDDVDVLRKLLTSRFDRSISRKSKDVDLADEEDDDNDDDQFSEFLDYSCLLIEFPDGEASPVEERLLSFCTYCPDDSDFPLINLHE